MEPESPVAGEPVASAPPPTSSGAAAPPPEEPLEVDPVDEETPAGGATACARPAAEAPTSPSPPAPHPAPRRGERYSLLQHYRRHLNFLVPLFLFVGAAGWTYRWYVLREVLIQVEASRLPDRAVRSMVPLLCDTLLLDRSAARRTRAAVLLKQDGRSSIPRRGTRAWDALLTAIVDSDPKVESAAWDSLISAGSFTHSEAGLEAWLSSLPVCRCVTVLGNTRSAVIRRGFLQLLEDQDADAYWTTAQWSLRTLDDPAVVDVVLGDARRILYDPPGDRLHHDATSMIHCLRAGLRSTNTRIRDRCRRLVVDYAPTQASPDDLVEWIATTRDASTTETIVRVARRVAQTSGRAMHWESSLKGRLAEETDLDVAVQLSVSTANMVWDDREREFLEAGLQNPDPQIREYFEQILAPPTVEPEDGR